VHRIGRSVPPAPNPTPPPSYLSDDGAGEDAAVVGPTVAAGLCLRPTAVGSRAVGLQEPPLRCHETPAPLPVGNRDPQQVLGVEAGGVGLPPKPAVMITDGGREVLQKVVTGHHEDGQSQEENRDHLEASHAPHVLQEAGESHLAAARPRQRPAAMHAPPWRNPERDGFHPEKKALLCRGVLAPPAPRMVSFITWPTAALG